MPHGRRMLTMVTLLAAMLAAAPALTGCQVNPATGEQQLNFLSEAQEVQIGQEAAPEFLAEYGGEVPSPQVQQFVSNLGRELAAQSERPDLPWEFYVLDSGVINAFALPGGKVFISRALLAEMNNTAQLAGVLAHEIGHVTAQHIGQQMSREIGFDLVLSVLGATVAEDQQLWVDLLGQGAGLYALTYSREQESESDLLGLRYMTRLGYDPRGMIQVMRILAETSPGGGPPEWMSTHPLPETRVRQLEQLIAEEYAFALNNPQFDYGVPAFQQNVLAPLSRLGPPRHNP